MKTTKLLWVFFSVAVVACGGGGGGGTTTDTTPPTVSFTSPSNNSTGVAVNAAITATFSENMDTATITTSTFTLNNGVTSGAVANSGTTASFTPASNFAYSTTYTATINTAVKDTADNAMISAYTWSFTTTAPPIITVTANGGSYTVNRGTIVEIDDSSLVLSGGDVSLWTLSSPTGSLSVMNNDTSSAISAPVTPFFQTDVPGNYVATLKIYNSSGIFTVSMLTVTAL